MDIRITIRPTAKGSTLATVCSVTPGTVRLHRITLPAGQDPEALHQQLHALVLAELEREAGPAGRVVDLRRIGKGG